MDNSAKNNILRLLLASLALYVVSYAFVYGGEWDFSEKSELSEIHGYVTKVEVTTYKRYPTLHIYVSDGVIEYDLIQDNYSSRFPKIKSLRYGDDVTALVADLCCQEKLKLWQLWRGDEEIINYEELAGIMKRRDDRTKGLGVYIFYAASAFLILWIYFKFVWLPRQNNSEDS